MFLTFLICVLVLIGFLVYVHLPTTVVENETNVNDVVSPVIQDFYINNTWAHESTQFSFNVTDNAALDRAVFGCNVTQDFVNDSSTPLVGTQAWANVTHTLPSYNCAVSFQLWLWNSNGSMSTTGLRYMRVYTYNNTSGAWNTPFISLSQAIQAIDSANNWTNVEIYAQTILAKKTTAGLASMIDGYASSGDWSGVLYWSAICNKLGVEEQTAINYALGNQTMVGSLPYSAGTSLPYFCPEDKFLLYGYWWANTSWAQAYNNTITAKWNITKAFTQFNASAYYSVVHSGGLPYYDFADGTGGTPIGEHSRYYDEDACNIACYRIFAEMLNVSSAMTEALHWWSYTNQLWTGDHYAYRSDFPGYECEAPYFLKIISELKYFYPTLGNWSRVLTDIENRFLGSEWNSKQWTDSLHNATCYAVIHYWDTNPEACNPQHRLDETVAAWQAMLGVFMQLSSANQNKMIDMLYGNKSTEPAWALLLTPDLKSNGQGTGAGLFNSTANLFSWSSADNGHRFANDNDATAYGEILLFLMGIVPENTTIAFPLEELAYEYIRDIDPQMFQFDLRTRTTTISMDGAGNMTFQYGVSPVTYVFSHGGIWQITFSNSWNVITNVTYMSALPTNRIYFMQTVGNRYSWTAENKTQFFFTEYDRPCSLKYAKSFP
jgi:hypothetical protein